jgi:YD repeat-containing protein
MAKTRSAALRLFLILVVLAATATAQKPPGDQLGFQSGRVYDSRDIDSVNLFNGVLGINIPIGTQFQVSPTLSYQLHLTYNSRPLETRRYPCSNNEQERCESTYIERSANAGIGWRVSLGQLIPPTPFFTMAHEDSFNRLNTYIYISPSGAEYHFIGSETHAVTFSGTSAMDAKPRLRMTRVSDTLRDIEFPSGEVHRFEKHGSRDEISWSVPVWRLIQIRDRKSDETNHVMVEYYPATGVETQWKIRDTTGRNHVVNFTNAPTMTTGFSKGLQITSVVFDSVGGTDVTYEFKYDRTADLGCSAPTSVRDEIPVLKSLEQPDGTLYTFDYNGTCDPYVKSVRLPTGGTIAYTYQGYLLGNTYHCAYYMPSYEFPGGVRTRTVSDGTTSRTWTYDQIRGPKIAMKYNINFPCGRDAERAEFPPDPSYWSRTSVIGPPDSDGTHTRLDHYFDVLPNEFDPGIELKEPLPGFVLIDHLEYGFPGTYGIPPPEKLKGPLTYDDTTKDVSALDTGGRRLVSQMYSGCTSTGDCTNGTLLRSTYTIHDTPEPRSERVVYHDETADCGTNPCEIVTTRSEGDGDPAALQPWERDKHKIHHFRKVTQTSNFPGAVTRTSFTNFIEWKKTLPEDPGVWRRLDPMDPAVWYNTSLFNERWVQDGSSPKAREQYSFNFTTAFLERHRVLAGATPGETDVLSVFTVDDGKIGNAKKTATYGGWATAQKLSTSEDLPNLTLPTNPERAVENTFTGPFLATSKFLTSGTSTTTTSTGFLQVDQTVDSYTGSVTAARDSAGAETGYQYDAASGRLSKITSPLGAVTDITYDRATGLNAVARPAAKVKVTSTANGVVTTHAEQRYYYDLLGRLVQQRLRMPNNGAAESWSVTQTVYDALGREQSRTVAKAAASGDYSALTGALSTSMTYDALGRVLTTSLPDTSLSVNVYAGITKKWRSADINTTPGVAPIRVWTAEEYDWQGQLVKITENSKSPTGADPTEGESYDTTYQYDIGGRLKRVDSGVQSRSFTYDNAGRLTSEVHPESGTTTYKYDSAGNVVERKVGSSTVTFAFDHAARLKSVKQSDTEILKEFTYGDEETGLTDQSKGKVVTAVRHNPHKAAATNKAVTESYTYSGLGGLLSKKKTTVGTREFVDEYSHNPAGSLETVTYPTCNGCTAPPRVVKNTYDIGLLKSVGHAATPGATATEIAGGFTYHANGMPHEIQHKNADGSAGPKHTVTIAANGMARPETITVSSYCTDLSITTPPGSTTVSPEQEGTLTVVAPNATTFQWFDQNDNKLVGKTSATLSIAPGTTTSYWVRVGNGTCTLDSAMGTIRVTGTGCGAILTQPQPRTARIPRNSTASFTIGVATGATVQWYEGVKPAGTPIPAPAGTSTTLVTRPLTTDTHFWARVTAANNSCAQDSDPVTAEIEGCSDVTITPSSPIVLANTAFTLTAPTFQGATYRWYSGSHASPTLLATTQQPTHNVSAGIDTYTQFFVEVEDSACNTPARRSQPVAITVCAVPAPRAIKGVIVGTGIELSVENNNDGVNFEWFEGTSYTDLSQPAGTGPSITIPISATARTFWVRMTRVCGSVTAETKTSFFTVDTSCAPSIYVQPEPVVKLMPAAAGGTVQLTTSVVAGPRGPFKYQWYTSNGAQIPGATGASYTWTHTYDGTTAPVQKSVYVMVEACGSNIQSQTVTLTASKTKQEISTFQTLRTIWWINGVKLQVGMEPERATGYTYQWYRDNGTPEGEPISGSGPEKTVEPSTIGTYWVKVTGPHDSAPDNQGNVYTLYGTVVSRKFYVAQSDACELPALRVTQNYGSVTGLSPSPAIIFEALLDWPAVQFQWYSGLKGDTRNPIASDSGVPNRLTVSSSTLRPYWVRAKLACGAFHDSDTLYYTRGNCGPVVINQNVPSTDVAYGGNASLVVERINHPNVTYTWRRADDRSFVGSGSTYTLTNVRASDRYFATVENNDCSSAIAAETFVATVRVASCPSLTPPTWVSEQWVDRDSTTVLSATTAGATSYQWYAGEVGDTRNPIGGGTLATYTTPAVTADVKYWVRVTGSSGCIVDSPTFNVRVCDKPTPAATIDYNNSIAAGQATYLRAQMSGTNLQYQWYVGESGTTGSPFNRHVDMIQVQPATTTRYWVRVTAHCGGGTRTWDSQTFTVSVCPTITADPTAEKTVVMPGKTTKLTVTALRADKYQWYIGEAPDKSKPVANSNSATITTPALTQPTKFWVEVTSGNCADHSSYVLVDICPASTLYFSSAKTKVEKNEFQVVEVRGAPDVDRVYQWYKGNAGDTTTPISSQPGLGISITETTTYWARVTFPETGCSMDTTALTIDVCVPKITANPQSSMIVSGTPTPLTVGADLTNVTYQWYTGNAGDTTNPLAGKTTATIEVAPTATTKYWARVMSSCNIWRDSTAAELTICQPPAITEEPHDVNSTATGAANLSVRATGSGLTYQWYRGLSGDTSTPLNKTTADISFIAGSTADYWVKVTGTCGTPKNSRTVKVSVLPKIDSFTTGGWVMPGSVRTLTVAATGNQLRYEWYKRTATSATIITGATSTTYTTPAITADSTYFARVYSGNYPQDTPDADFQVCQPLTLGWGGVQTQTTINKFQVLSFTGVTADMPHTTKWYEGPSGNTTKPLSDQENLGVSPAVTTSYWVRITQTDTGCYTDSATLTINVCIPVITTHPQSKMIVSGTSTPLTVAADLPGVTYQWYMGDSGVTASPISGQTSPTLNVSPQSTTRYWVRVTGSCGISRDSNTAEITICQAPAITQEPQDINRTATGSANLSVSATGSGLTYQWYKGIAGDTSTPLTGKTTAEISFIAGSTADYWVRITGTCGTKNSRTVKVSVPPTINSITAGGWVQSGAVKTLTVAATGNQLRYEWYKRVGLTTSIIPGATSTTYTTPAITVDTAFFARVYSGTYPQDSADALFQICQPLPLGWGNALTETTPNKSQTLSFTGVTADIPHTTQWYEGTTGNVTKPLSSQENLGISPAVTTSYWVRITRTDTGCVTDSTTLTIKVCVPTITTNPAASTMLDKVTNPSAYVRLTVAADITPVTYQWFIGASGVTTNPISGATSSYYDASPNADTTYWVRVTGSCTASKNSTTALVTLCKAPAISSHPQGLQTTAGVARQLSVTASGTDLTYAWYKGLPGNTTTLVSTAGATINVAPHETTDYWVKVSGRCGSVNSTGARVSVPPGITSHPAGGEVTKGTTRTLTVVASGADLWYQWYRRNPDGTATALSGAAANSYTTPALTADATYFCGVQSGTAAVYTNDAVLTVCQPRTIFVPSHNGISGTTITLSVADAGAGDTAYQWYRGATGDTSAPAGNGNSIAVAPLGTTSYWLRTTRASCYSDSAAVTVYICRPAITTQPVGGMIASGTVKQLTVAATGTAPISYQWYIGTKGVTSNPVSGQTSATLNAQPAATTTYWCRVTGSPTGCGVNYTDSEAATVQVCQPPTITRQPLATNYYGGSAAWLEAIATGDAISYQWYEGAAGVTTKPVTGATTNTLYARPANTTYYWLRVTGTCGVADSVAAKVSVAPIITQAPAPGVVCGLGETASFTIVTTGTELTYKWIRQYGANTPQVVATTQTAAIPIASTPVSIWCEVSSGTATTRSDAVDVTVRSKPTITAGPYVWGANAGWYRLRVDVPMAEIESGMTFKWYEGNIGDFSKPVTQYVYGWYVDVQPATRPKTYWVRVSFNDSGCYRDAQGTIP